MARNQYRVVGAAEREAAIERWRDGKGVTELAKDLGVHRNTITHWIRGSNDRLVAKYMRAATISSEPSLGDLTGFQRAALIGVLRLRRI